MMRLSRALAIRLPFPAHLGRDDHVQSTSCVGQRPVSLVAHSSHKSRLPSGQ